MCSINTLLIKVPINNFNYNIFDIKGEKRTSFTQVKNLSSTFCGWDSSESSGESRDKVSRKRFSVAVHLSLSFSLDSDRSSNGRVSESEKVLDPFGRGT